jgi:hypothetical protein
LAGVTRLFGWRKLKDRGGRISAPRLNGFATAAEAGMLMFHLERVMPASKLGAVEEPEVPLERLQEEVHHRVEHGGANWISGVALSAAILAVLGAIAALVSGDRANEAMMKPIESADQWAFYQAKGIKAAVLDGKVSLTGAVGEADRAKATKYSEQQNDIEKEARSKDNEVKDVIGCVFLVLASVQH